MDNSALKGFFNGLTAEQKVAVGIFFINDMQNWPGELTRLFVALRADFTAAEALEMFHNSATLSEYYQVMRYLSKTIPLALDSRKDGD